jgi:polyisoprenoid-binding protein YceI
MKNVLAVAVLAALPLAALAAPESYTFDNPHTQPAFGIDYVGFLTVRGRFDKSAGKFTIDRAAKAGSLDLAVESSSITTGDNERGARPRTRDEHLRSPDFFNVAEFPRMTYKASNVKFAGDAPTEVEGQLTLLGVTKPLTLKVERWKCGIHPFSKKEACGADVSGKFKRSDFGMKYGIPAIGDEVTLTFGFLAFKD